MLPGLAPFPPLASVLLIFAGGLCLGSFASAMAYRLPREIRIGGISRSTCPSCAHPLGFLDLIPLFSWLFLRGRCRYCHAPIGTQYPMIELATALLCLGFFAVYGFSFATIPLYFMAPVIVAIADIDLRHKIIPDGLNLSIFLLGVAALAGVVIDQGQDIGTFVSLGTESLIGCAVYGIGAWLLRALMMKILKKDPMGWGDIKFFAAAGFWLGLDADNASLFLLLTGLSGVLLAMIWKRVRGEAEFPFGPSLLLGFIAVLFWQGPVFYG